MDSAIKIGVLLAVLAIAGCGNQQEPAKQKAAAPTEKVEAKAAVVAAGAGPTEVEKYLMQQGVEIPTAFPSVSGLKAIVADNGQERRLMYVAPDGKSLIVGMVYDTQGRNITNEDMARASVKDVPGKAALSSTDLDELWKRAEGLNWIEEGAGDRVVYVIFDPTCPYCHRLWRGVRQAVDSGRVRVRWLPVAILSNSSKALAAAVYQSKDPSGAMTQMATAGLTPVTVDKETAGKLAHNLLLLRDTGHTGVPLLLFKDDAGAVGVEPELPSGPKFELIFGV